MQKFNIIEIASIVSKHYYLSVAIDRIDMVFNPCINEYGVVLHFRATQMQYIRNSDTFLYKIISHFVAKFIADIYLDYEAIDTINDNEDDLIIIY